MYTDGWKERSANETDWKLQNRQNYSRNLIYENCEIKNWWSRAFYLCVCFERLFLNHAKTPGFLASRREEFNLGPEMRLDRSELLCNKVLLKYKGDRESFWHRHQKEAKKYPLLVFSCKLYSHSQCVNEKKGMS